MNARVLKYDLSLPVMGVSKATMPVCAHVLSVAVMPDGGMVVWALVPFEDHRVEPREFVVVNTGAPFDVDLIAEARWIGRCASAADKIIWHVWERDA